MRRAIRAVTVAAVGAVVSGSDGDVGAGAATLNAGVMFRMSGNR